MVERLATFLDHDYSEDAEEILNFLENAGMLPPLIKDNGTVGLTGKEAVQLQNNGKVKISTWEPEDD